MLSLVKTSNYIKNSHNKMYAYEEFTRDLKNRLTFFIIILMTISQAAITIYLPSFPAMENIFQTDHFHLTLSLTLYFVAYGCSQFFYGPLSDIYGRRLIILIGIYIFIIASVICAFAPSINVFLMARMLQGIGIGCGDTMGRAILCDRYENKEFIKAASAIGMASTITPLLAPVLGGYFQEYLSWRVSFIVLSIYAVVAGLLFVLYLPETKPHSFVARSSLKNILSSYYYVITQRLFLGYFIPGLVCFLGETIYNMMSPFIMQEKLGLSPVQYGWLSIITVYGILIGTTASRYLSEYISYYRMVKSGMWILTFAGCCMLLPALLHYLNVVVIALPIFVFMIGLGLIYPNTNRGALQSFSHIAGTAGAMQGGLQMLASGSAGILLGMIPAETQLLLAIILTVISALGLWGFLALLKTAETNK